MPPERDLRTRQAELTALTSHPSWPAFRDEVERKLHAIERMAIAHTIGGVREAPVDPTYLIFLRGFAAGMRWFAAVPENAERSLEQYLKRVNKEEAA